MRIYADPAASANAYTFETGPGPYSFNLDVPTAHYMERNVHVPSDRFTVTGSIQIVTSRPDSRWGTLAAVELAGASEKDNVGFVAFVRLPTLDKIQLGVRDSISGTPEPNAFASLPFKRHVDSV